MIGCLDPRCSRTSLCDRCVDDTFAQLRGVAAARGTMWADRARAAGRTMPWPSWDAARARAVEIVANIAGEDPRLLERLARCCFDEAARWFEKRAG